MHKITLLSIITALIALSSCQRSVDSNLINFDFKTVKDIQELDLSTSSTYEDISISILGNYFKDSLAIAMAESSKGFLFSISTFPGDSLQGSFCEKGRTVNEPIDIIPHLDLIEDADSLSAWFYAYPSDRFFKWNITASLASGNTVYDEIDPIRHDNGKHLDAFSFHYLHDSRMIVLNARQDAYKEWMVAPPNYEIYDLKTGMKEREYCPFNQYEGKSSSSLDYNSKVFLSLTDCIKPSRDKIAFGMMFMPYVGIIDTTSGEIHGIRLKGYPGLNTKERYYHFIDIECDDDYVYALYCGGDRSLLDNPESSCIFVFNWNLDLVAKYLVQGSQAMKIDGEKLYLLNLLHNRVYSLNTKEFPINTAVFLP